MTGLPLVLVHGFMGGGDQWAEQREYFSPSYEIVTPDLPGFGSNSNLIAPDTINGFAQFVLDELTAKGIERFVLLGHSMGGMIVQEMVAIAAERIDRLVLYGTASTGNLPGRFETFETSKQRILEDGVIASARRISSTWFLNHESTQGYEACAKIAEQSSLQAMLAGLDAMKSWNRTENLTNILCPTLIVWGEADRTYKWQQIDELWNSTPNVSLSVMPGCSHAAHLEKPKLFNALVDDFLL